MNVLYLGPHSPLVDFLSKGNAIRRVENSIPDFGDADFVISYGYRHIIRNGAELKRMDGRAINLHISYLPWNRGADPNLWSWIENSPKGITIHCLDCGIDTGDILCQAIVDFSGQQTLSSSYQMLQRSIQELFMKRWESISSGECPRTTQLGSGSFHRSKDKETVPLPYGWDTPVANLRILNVDRPGVESVSSPNSGKTDSI